VASGEGVYAHPPPSHHQRKRLARKLAELEASQRQTARTLGVGEATVNYDVGERPRPHVDAK
jgi:hypothetical protein